MQNPPRPLGLLAEVVQQIGMGVTDEHDDLVFVSHNLFIFKFTDQSDCIDLYFNEDIEEEKAQALMALLEAAAEIRGLQIRYRGAYCLTPKDEDNVELELFDLADDVPV